MKATRAPLRLEGSAGWPRAQMILAFATLCLVWGLAFVVFHLGLAEVPPLTFSALRALLAGLGFVIVLVARGERPPRNRAFHRTALVLGLTNVAAFWGLQALALTRIRPGEAAILVYVQPLAVAVGAWLVLGEVL